MAGNDITSAERTFGNSQVAAWGPEVLARLLEESAGSKITSTNAPSLLHLSQEQEAWNFLEHLPDGFDLTSHIAIYGGFNIELLRSIGLQRRKKGPGLFICVIIPKCGFSYRFKSFQELRIMSAVFTPPDEAEAQLEQQLLESLIEFRSEEGYVITSRNAQKSFVPLLKTLDNGKGRFLCSHWRLGESNIAANSPYFACSASFGGLVACLMLHSVFHQKNIILSRELQVYGGLSLASWWNGLAEEVRIKLCPWLDSKKTGEDLLESIKNTPLGSDIDIATKIEIARADYVGQLLVHEETLEEESKVSKQSFNPTKKTKKKKLATKTVKNSDIAIRREIAARLVDTVIVESMKTLVESSRTETTDSEKTNVSIETPPVHPLIEHTISTVTRERRGSSSDFSSFSTISEEELNEITDDVKWEKAKKRRQRKITNKVPKIKELTMINAPSNMQEFTIPLEEQKSSLELKIEKNLVPNSLSISEDCITVIKPTNPSECEVSDVKTEEKLCKIPESKQPTPSLVLDGKEDRHMKPRSKSNSRSPIRSKVDSSLNLSATGLSPTSQTTNIRPLHTDIQEMAASLDLIATRRQPWQLAVAERVKQVVYSIWPRAWCDVFGSIASGLAAPCSDVDMVVRGVSQTDRVRILAQQLQRQEWVQMLQAVERTAVPVVKFNTAAIPIAFGNRGNLIAVDITFENEAHHGLNTCGLVRQFLQRWPPLKPLVLVLKQFLVEKGLNDPYVGGLSSYGLVLMVAAILRRHWPIGLSPASQIDLGALFIEFLEVYSSRDFVENGVRLAGEGGRKRLGDPCYIEDPLDPNNNVGRSCFGIHQVVASFSEALEAIRGCGQDGGNLPPNHSILGRVFATSHHIDVVRLVTKVWCPLELPSQRTSSSQQEPIVPIQAINSPPRWFFLPQNHTAAYQPTGVTTPFSASPSNQSAIEQWIVEMKLSLLKAIKNSENDIGICSFCSQPTGHNHSNSNCELLRLVKNCPI